jgi:thymidylate synthase (FAD)
MINVTLVSCTPNPEKTVAAAARLCYAQADIQSLMEHLTDDKAESFVSMLREIGHESPIEHVSFTFAVEGVSRALLAQLTRHRIASYSVQSQRYVRKNNFGYVTPPEISADPHALALFEQAMASAGQAYEELSNLLRERHRSALENEGVPSAEAARRADKMAIEDARYVLPNACDTRLMLTMNARSLLNFFSHRLCMRAQWEIRELAAQMLTLVRREAPALFCLAGPPCVRGACPEGKMSCGRMAEMRALYGQKEDSANV